jgi:hypothetical protein
MFLVSSPEGVLLGAGNTCEEVRAILKRSAQDFSDCRVREEIRAPRRFRSESDVQALSDRISAEAMKFIDDCLLEEIS